MHPRRENAPERRTGGRTMDPVISELLRQCGTVEDFAAQIDGLAARLLEVASGAPEPPRPREQCVLAGLRLRAVIPALLAMFGVRG